MSETIRDNVLDERYEIQVVVTQQLPHEPLPGEVLVNAPNNYSVLTSNQKRVSHSSQDEEIKEKEEEEYEVHDEGTRTRYERLYEAALEGDWSKAEGILKHHPSDVRAEISDLRDTVLHVAVTAGQSCFVKELMGSNYLNENDLEMKNYENNTAFSIAAVLGDTELAGLMFNKNQGLAMIRNRYGKLPVLVAAKLGHEKMVRYLYPATKDTLTEEERIELLVRLIDNDSYDIARLMVAEFSSLAVSRVKVDQNKKGEIEEKIGETALHALARKPLNFYDFDKPKQGILKRYYYQFSRTNEMQNKGMHPEALKLVKLLWDKVVDQLDYHKILELIRQPRILMFDAAKEGNMDFLSIITSKHPSLLWELNKEKYSIFHTAVSYRHENFFELMSKRPSIKNFIFSLEVGKEKNNILHLVANLPPDLSRLDIVPGAALQMQKELWWFKKLRKLMPPFYAEAKNAMGKTAHTLFTESHKPLMKEGEAWMKQTAESCMLVATLIATVVFAAAFTVPGGLNDNTGTPFFIRKAAFIIFAVSDTISLVYSVCSILIFLSIFTVRYAEEDFLEYLPKMLQIGLCTLFISIIGMMVVFCATLFIVFAEGTVAAPVLGIAIAPIPVVLFSYQQKLLIFDVQSKG